MVSHSVLVVDDDKLIRESLCELLGDLGCRVTGADRGLRAIEFLRQSRRDLLVSDVDMPDISGFELLSRLRREELLCPTVLISARADEGMAEAARDAGAMGLFPKPVALPRFRHFISAMLTTDTDHGQETTDTRG